MEHAFWKARWASGQIGWHEQAPNASLVRHMGVLGLGAGRRVLVPLAGKSTDLSFLSATGAEVIGSELVEEAAQAFFVDQGLSPTREILPSGAIRLADGGVAMLVGDFFALTPSDVGRIDAVYDRAALVALPPELRVRYAAQLRTLAPGTPLLTITFVHDAPADAPPFSVDSDELARLFPGSSITHLGERDAFVIGGGLAARGATFARELAHCMPLRPL